MHDGRGRTKKKTTARMSPTVKIKRAVTVAKLRQEEVVGGVSRALVKAAVEQESDESDSESGSEEGDGLRLTPEEILRRHFESQFAPLEESQSEKSSKGSKRSREDDTDEENEEQDGEEDGQSYDEESDDEEANSDEDKYDGFSDISEEDALLRQEDEEEEEDESGPEVVDYTGTRFKPTAILPKAHKSELKAFMVYTS